MRGYLNEWSLIRHTLTIMRSKHARNAPTLMTTRSSCLTKHKTFQIFLSTSTFGFSCHKNQRQFGMRGMYMTTCRGTHPDSPKVAQPALLALAVRKVNRDLVCMECSLLSHHEVIMSQRTKTFQISLSALLV